jgi:hypothetical protein
VELISEYETAKVEALGGHREWNLVVLIFGPTYAELCRLNYASRCFKSRQSMGNGVGDGTQFGIIRVWLSANMVL